MQNTIGPQPQAVQVPNYSGVNIQIFNPSVAAPGATAPASTVNSTNYSPAPSSYPPSYYTQNMGLNSQNQPPQPQMIMSQNAPAAPVAPVAPAPEVKKTEKREITQLTDDYVRNLESFLNSQDEKNRMTGAKEVLARLQEDDSRKNDAALNALVNKMLQDPSEKVKFIALAALDTRAATGNNKTVQILKGIQQQNTAYGEDSRKATEILLKMSGTPVQKEFEVKEKPASAAKPKDKKKA